MSKSNKRKAYEDMSSSSKKSKTAKSYKHTPMRTQIKGSIAPYGGKKELKYIDIAPASYVIDTTGVVTCLNLVAQETDNTNRVGKLITVKSVQIKGHALANAAAVTPQKGRVMLVWDNANNSSATIAAISDILETADVNSMPKVNNSQRFTILWDYDFTLGSLSSATPASGADACKLVDYYRKLDNAVQYSSTGATIGNIQNGALLMVTLGSVAAGTAAAALKASTRVRFTDS